MTQRAFQEALPDNMYVFPVDSTSTAARRLGQFAKTAPKPYTVPPQDIAEHRDAWLREWGEITSG